MIVLDASVVLDLLLGGHIADALAERVWSAEETLHAPQLLDLEVLQVLRRYVREGQIDLARAEMAVTDLSDLPIVRHPHDLFVRRIWELRDNLTAYDAAYIALAEALPATLLTRDQRLASVSAHLARMEIV